MAIRLLAEAISYVTISYTDSATVYGFASSVIILLKPLAIFP